MNALRLAVTWLTVAPIRGPNAVDRIIAGRSISLSPVIGIVLGALVSGVTWACMQGGLSAQLTGWLAVGTLALLTRGMHLDGLADTLDGLGSYGGPDRAQEVMRSGGSGPFGVAGLVVCLAISASCIAILGDQSQWLAVGLAVAVGRVAIVLACMPNFAASRPGGFGELVVASQRWWIALGWIVIAAAAAWVTAGWLAVGALFLVLAVTAAVVRHCVRRLGGLSGDVLGLTCEITTAAMLLGGALAL